MDENGDEEDAIEVWNRGSGADDSAPEETHGPVGNVVLVRSCMSLAQRKARQSKTHGFTRVFPPPTSQKAVSADIASGTMITDGGKRVYLPMGCLDESRVLDGTPGKLRESLAVVEDALSLHFESALL